jgi:pimeloyl-ACP methyl ester carboxylesterase
MTSAPLDAAGSDQATVFEMNAAGVAMNFAATYPERVRSLIAVNVRSSWGEFLKLSPAQHKRLAIRLRSPELVPRIRG